MSADHVRTEYPPMTARRGWRSRAGRVVGAVAVCALALGGSAGIAGATPRSAPTGRAALVVDTTSGSVRGKATAWTRAFLGIPYAAAPVGALRWRAPQPAASWTGIRSATSYGSNCAQPASPLGVPSASENCLFLNVFTPKSATAGRHLPVVVWFHGGAFNFGESNDYNPVGLVRDGVIVVTVNYRIGALGFLAHPALTGPGGSSGNYGLMDQQAALRWVQRDVARFGGDPSKVTAAGQSAGALSVLAQVASPGAHGLFSRAVLESTPAQLTPEPKKTAEAEGSDFAVKTGCTDQSAACLRRLPVATILADENPAAYIPDIDGRVLTRSLQNSFATGRFNRVPILNGTTHDEYRLFVGISVIQNGPVTAADYKLSLATSLAVTDPAAVQAIAAEYPLSHYSSPAVALSAAGTDQQFACTTLATDKILSAYVPIYTYEFNDENAPERYVPAEGFPYGAAHASELQYLFTLRHAAVPGTLDRAQQHLAATMRDYWTQFATTGSPNTAAAPEWPRFRANDVRILSLTEPVPKMETTFSIAHHCGFWSTLG